MQAHLFIEACREGAARLEAAIRLLHREIGEKLQREAYRDLRDPHAASDVVQEALIKVWQRCGSFRGDSELLAWVRVIMRRCLVDRLRQDPRQDAMDDEAGALRPEVEASLVRLSMQAGFDPESVVRGREAAACFQRCFARFRRASPRHAAVIGWIVQDGLSHEEVAQLLQRTPGATRQFISEAYKKVRIHFAEWYELVAESRPITGAEPRHG